jgi:hypothetical protein
MNRSPSPYLVGCEGRAVRGHVVTFRPAARIAMQPRRLRSGRVPGVLLRLDERRRRHDPARRKWFANGSEGTLLRFFLKVFRSGSTSPTGRVEVTHGPMALRDDLAQRTLTQSHRGSSSRNP